MSHAATGHLVGLCGLYLISAASCDKLSSKLLRAWCAAQFRSYASSVHPPTRLREFLSVVIPRRLSASERKTVCNGHLFISRMSDCRYSVEMLINCLYSFVCNVSSDNSCWIWMFMKLKCMPLVDLIVTNSMKSVHWAFFCLFKNVWIRSYIFEAGYVMLNSFIFRLVGKPACRSLV